MNLVRAGAALAAMALLTACGSSSQPPVDATRPAATQPPAGSGVRPSASASSVPAAITSEVSPHPDPSSGPQQGPVQVRLPPAAGRFDYQIGGAYPPMAAVAIVDRDRTDAPQPGVYNICYLNAFQSQPDEAATWTGSRSALLLHTPAGRLVTDPDWPGEHLLDTSTAARRRALAGVVGGWIDGCRAAGYDAIEPDNLDSWTRSKGLLTAADNLAMSALLSAHAHAAGLAIAQKNAVEISAKGARVAGFDFALAEECQVYSECDGYTRVYGAHVIEIEYTDNSRTAFTRACAARGSRISVILRDRDVVARGRAGYTYRTC